ncbi:DUF4296 domain-containing protein [Bacteroidota bacterium]
MRFSRFLLLCLLILSVAGCTNKKEAKPDALIEEGKMVKIMTDMHLVETAQNLKIIQPDSANANYLALFESIYKTHQVSKSQFDSSLFYYSGQPEQMNELYDKVLERLYELESEVNAE